MLRTRKHVSWWIEYLRDRVGRLTVQNEDRMAQEKVVERQLLSVEEWLKQIEVRLDALEAKPAPEPKDDDKLYGDGGVPHTSPLPPGTYPWTAPPNQPFWSIWNSESFDSGTSTDYNGEATVNG